jgi:hypothetical protein
MHCRTRNFRHGTLLYDLFVMKGFLRICSNVSSYSLKRFDHEWNTRRELDDLKKIASPAL